MLSAGMSKFKLPRFAGYLASEAVLNVSDPKCPPFDLFDGRLCMKRRNRWRLMSGPSHDPGRFNEVCLYDHRTNARQKWGQHMRRTCAIGPLMMNKGTNARS